jgi:hypothetical protein
MKRERTSELVNSFDDSLGLLVRVLFTVFDRRLEVLDALAQPLAQIGQLAWSKDEKRNSQNNQNFRQPQFSRHVKPPQRVCQALGERIASWRGTLWKF